MAETSELIQLLLTRRNIIEKDAIEAFLNPSYETHLHDPLLLADMRQALDRIFDAMDRNERIIIYGDFDCDGIPGTAVLFDTFKKIGYTNLEVYIPHRDKEGYGFHQSAIDSLAQRNAKLIITVDVGTTAVASVAYAREQGIDCIITDHHEIPGELPDAVAVINPKREGYPFPSLCGAGVAFKLACAMINEGKRRNREQFLVIAEGWEKWLLDLVAIATIADMVPLVGENRALAYWGLQVLRKSKRPGITALCNKLRLKKEELTEDDIGFSIAPRINAASRMDNPDLAFALLTTESSDEAEQIAAQLESLNTKRKSTVAGIVKQARVRMKERFNETDRAVVLGDPEWKPSLLGLAANSLLEGRSGIVCLWGRDANGALKGSARTDGSVSVIDVFSSARDALLEFGGHAASGGFSVSSERVHSLPRAIQDAVDLVVQAPAARSGQVDTDAVVALSEFSWPLLREVARLSPYGVGNPKPVFRVSRVSVLFVKRFGKEGNHIELQLADLEWGGKMRAFQFFKAPEDFTHTPERDDLVDVFVTLERDSFKGPYALALRIIDILPANS